MGISILDLLNQVKQFISQEKGTYFSLFVFFLLGITLGERFVGFFDSLGYTIPEEATYGTIILFVCLVWLHIRHLKKRKKKINIAISPMDILNISTSNQLNTEQKLQISNEVVNYIYNRLSHVKQVLKLDNHMHFLKLPSRLSVDYANSLYIAKRIDVDMIIRGTVRYEQEVIYINTKLAFNKEISSVFFRKLINDFNAYPELTFSFSSNQNLEFDKFIHEVTYLSVIYRALDLINDMKYQQAEELLLHGIEKLYDLYANKADQSVNRGDKEVSKIEVLLYHVLSKNYFLRSSELLTDFDYKNIANDLLDKCADAIQHQLSVIKEYLHDDMFSEVSEKIQLENSYYNAMSKLGKTGNKEVINEELESVDEYIKSDHKHGMVHALIEARFENYTDAKKHYEKALEVDPNNTVALRGLGLIYFSEKRYKKARQYFLSLSHITDRYIFNPHQYDIKVQHRLYRSSFLTGHLLDGVKHLWKYGLYKYKNAALRKKMYYL